MKITPIEYKLFIKILHVVQNETENIISNIRQKEASPVMVKFIHGWGKKDYLRDPYPHEIEKNNEIIRTRTKTYENLITTIKSLKYTYQAQAQSESCREISTEEELENVLFVIEEYEYSTNQFTFNFTGRERLLLNNLYQIATREVEEFEHRKLP